MRNDWPAAVVALVVVVLSVIWYQGHQGADIRHALCPDPLMAAGHTVSCTGLAGVHLVTPTPAAPPAVGR